MRFFKTMHLLKCMMTAALLALAFLAGPNVVYAAEAAEAMSPGVEEAEKYNEYKRRFDEVKYQDDIGNSGFRVIEDQIFPIEMGGYGDAFFVPAMDEGYDRLLLFFVAADGEILYKTDQLETNGRNRGRMEQPNRGISAVSFQDVNRDGLMDIVLIKIGRAHV